MLYAGSQKALQACPTRMPSRGPQCQETRSEGWQQRLLAQPGHEVKAPDSGDGRAKPSEDIWIQLEVNGTQLVFPFSNLGYCI